MLTERAAVYLAGVATLPALAVVMATVYGLVRWVREWGRPRCHLCKQRALFGPHGLMIALHSRARHGLALTLWGRRRLRQWHGMSLWYAVQHGVPEAEWRRASQAFTAQLAAEADARR